MATTVKAGNNYPKNSDFGDYVPLFLMPYINTFDTGMSDYAHSGEYANALVDHYVKLDLITPLHVHMKTSISGMNVQTSNARVAFFETYGPLINGYLESESTISFTDFSFTMQAKHDNVNSSYNQLFASQASLTPSLIRLRSQSYYSGLGSLFTDKGHLIWTLAVRKEHVKYVKLCYLLGKPINPAALVLITQTGFDTRASFNKPLRTAYRKHMRDWIIEGGVTIVEMDFTEMLCGRITVPNEIASIKDIKQWEVNTVNNFVDGYIVENELCAEGVELSF